MEHPRRCSDEDVHIRSATGWYKRVLDTMDVHLTIGVPYTHISSPLSQRQSTVVEQILWILMKQERTKDWVNLLSRAVLTMKSEKTSSTGYGPRELFHGGLPARFFQSPFL